MTEERRPGREDRRLVCSKYASFFAHMGEVYVYHDLYGFILKMSPDILDFLVEFKEPIDPATVCTRYNDAFEDQPPEAFVGIFIEFCCLVTPGVDELASVWNAVPLKGKWNVWEKHEDGGMTFYAGWGDRDVTTHRLSAAEAAVWDTFDGETRLDELKADHDEATILGVVEKLGHHKIQASKLSKVKLSMFQGRMHLLPPYMASTMPYPSYDPETDPTPKPFEATFSPAAYYEEEVADADAQFDHEETTLSHLFRKPHPALDRKTYGEALVDGLVARDLIAEGGAIKVLEIGAGLGYVAEAVCKRLMALGCDVSYDILELSPALAKAQRTRCSELPITVHEGNALEVDWPGSGYDFILANEMIGDLPAHKIDRDLLGIKDGDVDEEVFESNLEALGAGGAAIKQYKLPIVDAPEECYLNLGAFGLLERIDGHLNETGFAVLTEFGELRKYPVLSTQLDHPELSIHFGHLLHVAFALGLKGDLVCVMDLIEMETELPALATTRSYFKALTALMATHGVTLEKIGYTKAMLEILAEDKLDISRVGDLSYQRIQERLMGLVPHEFKALIIGKNCVGTIGRSSLLAPGMRNEERD